MIVGSDFPPFTYHRAEDLADALAQLRRDGASVYAGGTDLLVALRLRADWVANVRHLVDIKGVREARGITSLGDSIRIGALTTAKELASSASIRRHARVLAMAAAHTSAPSLRARGTVGGNVMTPHPAGDVATALLALGASAEVAGADPGQERMPVADLLSGRVSLSSGALLLGFHVPRAGRSWYERMAPRLAFSRATRSVAIVVHSSHTTVACSGVAARPRLMSPSDAMSPDDELLAALMRRGTERVARR